MNEISNTHWVSMSDETLIKTIGRFIRHHRLQQNKTQEEVATAAGMSRSTLSLLERGETVTINTLMQALRVLDLLYVMNVFTISDTISPLAYAKLKKEQRERASSKTNKVTKKEDDLGW
ncbi:helix-turn-helix domain-containing protein [Gelidibacter salicanalis]|uniref:Helix-turn-helix domain-containing protein n=1 Tax=Gelidibacter salicanalis TaxID=291193 RepID=A0A934NBN9_9FLAO|nr:helix-turn-helix transcriptional regulator [Gelidibacter salicanalis]MBJ7879840.1 helix-turn-helix domain-containing protein [Gelidibacter salicanalis]